ncbi:site-specific integrase [Rhodobacter capsulatus]|uniref:Site-specific integrase n=1 Tax=Rhodobacter capsulatus TaxID=1061 RepID=A0A4U1JNW0_RHOCA|nr:site-specific integrase [Rhodobacter capsulatus]TKD17654.1 site-specific integrase [Rhodobacter capsulatus]
MKSTHVENTDTSAATMQEVLDWMAESKPWSAGTLRDYTAQVLRVPEIYNANRLCDVLADLPAFQARFARRAFPDNFRTPAAYDAWRKKIVTILKRFHGVADEYLVRKNMQDEWTALITAMQASQAVRGPALVSIKILADEARRAGLTPRDLERDWLLRLCDDLGVGRRRSIVKAISMLRNERAQCPLVDALLPVELPDIAVVRRQSAPIFPAHIDAQIDEVVRDYCGGTYDEILDERVGGKSEATINSYKAALRKYVDTALNVATVPSNDNCLTRLLDRYVFNSVMRAWMAETDKSRKISARTMRTYTAKIRKISAHINLASDYIDAALKNNRHLKKGREDATQMPEAIQIFCRRLLRDRRVELTFLSLHLRFQQASMAFLKEATDKDFEQKRHKAISLGVLAAYSAIALWSTPLRISNLRCLRIHGANPSLILPSRAGGDVYVLVDAGDVKNRRPVRAKLNSGPTRALDVLWWYIREIRPMLPHAASSEFLFPGFEREVLCAQVIRNWLADSSRDFGMPMHPHNYRHGLATLYLRDHPGDYSGAARLLFVTPNTVRLHYAWIDQEAALRQVQSEVAKMAGVTDGIQ